jgi:hypothetical protein
VYLEISKITEQITILALLEGALSLPKALNLLSEPIQSPGEAI